MNFEQRPLNWIEDWDNRSAGEPHQQNWYRFIDGETFDDPWLDACRSLVVLDIDSWASATRAHDGLVAHAGTIWTPDEHLVATGGSTLLCRPAARRPDGR